MASTFNLSDINGSNGFVIDDVDLRFDEAPLVSSIGDVNGDGFDDLATADYVVFGASKGFGSALDPSSLDGSNGFSFTDSAPLPGRDSDFSFDDVRGAGDVNGDGIDDFIVGDEGRSPGVIASDFPGRSYVVFGSRSGFGSTLDFATLDGTNGFLIVDENFDTPRDLKNISSNLLGASVSGAGDLNGDGFDDLVIGAPFGSFAFNEPGKSFIVFGTASDVSSPFDLSNLDGSNGFVLEGIKDNDDLGEAVSSAGDVNGDGLDDLIVGAPGAGKSYVVFGRNGGFESSLGLADLDGQNGFALVGDANVGASVSGAGDVNGDGIDDVIVGGSRSAPDGTATGASYVVFGSSAGFDSSVALSELNGENGFAIAGTTANEGVGTSVGSAGDVNNDGIDDIIVGAARSNADDGSDNSYIIYGSTSGFDASIALGDLDSFEGIVVEGAGSSVSGAGDFNGDGTDDLAIAERATREGNTRLSNSYVVFGPATGEPSLNALPDAFTTDSDTVVSGNLFADNGSGADVVTSGTTLQLNGAEVELGSPVELPSGALLTLRADGTFDYNPNGQFDELTNFDSTTDSFEYSLVDGNLENTATVTITINSAFETPTPTTVFGPTLNLESTLNGRNGFVVNGIESNDRIGSIVSSAGDVNGDGLEDLIFGTAGESYVVFGSSSGFDPALELSSLDGTNGFALTGAEADRLASGAGDVNADGIDDLIFGTTFESNDAAYVVYGTTAGFESEVDLSALDGASGFVVGKPAGENVDVTSVNGAGDVNSDGIDDFGIVTNANADGGGKISQGYIVFGSADGLNNLALSSLDGSNGFVVERDFPASADTSVRAAGDVNGDGVGDLIVGSFFDQNGPRRADYVVFGSGASFESSVDLANLDSREGFLIEGTVAGFVGDVIRPAGDINGDGVDDLVGGSVGGSLGYVLFGSASGFSEAPDISALDGSNGFTIAGRAASFEVTSVNGIGDINSDGLDDLIVGDAEGGTSESGISYVIFGSTDGFGAEFDPESLDGTNGFVVEGLDSGDIAGREVSGAGDVNGDRVDDWVIGAPGADPNGSNSGESYVLFGRTAVSETPLNPSDAGTAGNDGITGTAATELLEGLAGNDAIDGRAGDDTLDGGEGIDTAVYQFDSAGVVVDLGAGSATDGTGDTDTLVSIENVIGSEFDDTLSGDENNNNLTGRKGNDTLEGGLGDDTIVGGNGADRLVGGSGADRFLYVAAAERGDAIADFEPGTDKLLLIGAAFGGLTKGELIPEQFFTGVGATSASQRIGYNTSTGEVLFDADGAGGTDAQVLATLAGNPDLSRTDITVL